MGLQDYVHFLGFKENPYPLIKSCDVFVLSSIYEGLPPVIIEALILERNIVSSPCVGAEEVLCLSLIHIYVRYVPLPYREIILFTSAVRRVSMWQ